MKLEQIQSSWETDCKIDSTALGEESLKIPSLHSKYYRMYINERVTLTKLNAQYKILKHEKTEFLFNPTEEYIKERGWKIPERGRILKNEIHTYLEGDTELIELELKIGIQSEKVDFLKSILQSLTGRGFLIKNAIEDRRWLEGQ